MHDLIMGATGHSTVMLLQLAGIVHLSYYMEPAPTAQLWTYGRQAVSSLNCWVSTACFEVNGCD